MDIDKKFKEKLPISTEKISDCVKNFVSLLWFDSGAEEVSHVADEDCSFVGAFFELVFDEFWFEVFVVEEVCESCFCEFSCVTLGAVVLTTYNGIPSFCNFLEHQFFSLRLRHLAW